MRKGMSLMIILLLALSAISCLKKPHQRLNGKWYTEIGPEIYDVEIDFKAGTFTMTRTEKETSKLTLVSESLDQVVFTLETSDGQKNTYTAQIVSDDKVIVEEDTGFSITLKKD